MTDPQDRTRCSWVSAEPEYQRYHDLEWGTELHGDDALFERLSLEAFQSGLSWITILRKRENFRVAFAGFSIERVARFGPDDEARLLADVGIVRNRAKVAATVNNARVAAELSDGLDQLLWSFAPAPETRRAVSAQIPASSSASVAMAKELKRRGFAFVGPTTAYALMQATGMVFDHTPQCWRWSAGR